MIYACIGSFCGYYLALAAWRHRHHWMISGTSYTPPPPSGRTCIVVQKRYLQGMTTVYLRCTGCGQLQEIEVFGEYKPGSAPTDDELAALRRMAGIENL